MGSTEYSMTLSKSLYEYQYSYLKKKTDGMLKSRATSGATLIVTPRWAPYGQELLL